MSAYRVGRQKDGHITWWQSYEQRDYAHEEVRDATVEESKLMDKIVWKNDNLYDRTKLRDLLADIRADV